ncbi:endonuclease VIII [Carnimonas bestiolae]|uniref:endonuclease VIII n=1 Tax=Carnimonas bestiolae TaxID=3402172 RepID=UPI003EDBCE0A
MPEGPEIRRVADRLDKVLADRPLESVWCAFESIQKRAAHLQAHRILRVESRGKALLTHFDEGSVIYSHNQLYGVWRVVSHGSELAGKRSPRLLLSTQRHDAWLLSASDIELLDERELSQHRFIAALGPDPLAADTDTEQLLAHITQPRFASRQLGPLLLEQRFVAGIGNYLRSEILFFAGLLPDHRIKALSPYQQRYLADTILTICRRAYHHAGVTNAQAWRAPMIAAGQPRRRWRHAVFNRAGEPCHACGTLIQRRNIATRRLYYCPSCQA